MNGKGLVKYTNGDIFEGEFKSGIREGSGIIICKNGT